MVLKVRRKKSRPRAKDHRSKPERSDEKIPAPRRPSPPRARQTQKIRRPITLAAVAPAINDTSGNDFGGSALATINTPPKMETNPQQKSVIFAMA